MSLHLAFGLILQAFCLLLAAAGQFSELFLNFSTEVLGRDLDKRQTEEGLRNWEDEGGNLAPPIDRVVASTAVHPGRAPTP